jgi:hypothetical protein
MKDEKSVLCTTIQENILMEEEKKKQEAGMSEQQLLRQKTLSKLSNELKK